MATPKELFYEKRGKLLVENLKKRHFDAYYCADKNEALEIALSLIPKGSSVGWGGTISVSEIGLQNVIRSGNYCAIDRESATTTDEKIRLSRECLFADFFLTGSNAVSMDGQLVNIDGTGNRVAALIYGPKEVIVIVGMNKVCDTVDDALNVQN